MEVTRVIVKKHMTMSDKLSAVSILSALNIEELTTIANKKDKELKDAIRLAQMVVQFDRAAELFGFKDCQDMIDFVKIYGVNALLE